MPSFDFIPDFEAPGPTLPSLDAPGAGWVWAEAASDAPNKNDAENKTCSGQFCSIRIAVLWSPLRSKQDVRAV
jgi:hypothetical protein